MYTKKPLPWPETALEPYISAETMQYHHGKHYSGYVDKVNALTSAGQAPQTSLLELVLKEKGPVFNPAAQAWNHEFYWDSLAPSSETIPDCHVVQQIKKDFGSLDHYKEEFTKAATNHFGSGWIWLVWNEKNGRLEIVETHDAGNPLTTGYQKPLLNLDVWEHAYYIDYRNARAKYIDACWKLTNWKFAEDNFLQIKQI